MNVLQRILQPAVHSWAPQPCFINLLYTNAHINIHPFYLCLWPSAASKITSKETQAHSSQGHPFAMQTTGLTRGWPSRLAPAPSHDLTLCPSPLSPSALVQWTKSASRVCGCMHYQATCHFEHSFISYIILCVFEVCVCTTSQA